MSKWKIPAALTGGVLALGAVFATTAVAQAAPSHTAATTATTSTHQAKPTIVLVSGAFEDSTSWSGEITSLEKAGYPVIAPAVPLRGVASDSAYLTALVRSIKGQVVLVSHSYGGLLTTQIAAQDPKQVKALVYAASLIPEAGQTANQLITQFPGSLLGPNTTYTVAIPGGTDTYVKPASFGALFAGDRTPAEAAADAATQRPIASSALGEAVKSGVPAGVPVYAIVASHDMAIPPAAERYEAEQAHAVSITTVGSSHDLPTSHPGAVTAVIERAAR
jgi:pimeloyl-ACP methyl ester carboxylesterase